MQWFRGVMASVQLMADEQYTAVPWYRECPDHSLGILVGATITTITITSVCGSYRQTCSGELKMS